MAACLRGHAGPAHHVQQQLYAMRHPLPDISAMLLALSQHQHAAQGRNQPKAAYSGRLGRGRGGGAAACVAWRMLFGCQLIGINEVQLCQADTLQLRSFSRRVQHAAHSDRRFPVSSTSAPLRLLLPQQSLKVPGALWQHGVRAGQVQAVRLLK